ncbi:hypothetical protein TRICI_003268 [Trichomonascus ciferrii]|uniref:Small ribosomal subunit protein mS33 n=1 Tax=Trichomonascus ciferrii TaxID=44093 RepID=A0A642V9J0_9ASCO|nr:hypothetical protein TRICI_003268 [Trichomonascus ciferrii]
MSSLMPSRARMLQVMKLSKSIFHETFNPDNTRNGAKVLRQRLKGDIIKNYYRPNVLTLRELRAIHPEGNHYDDKEERRLAKIAVRKKKGKGKPAKSKGKA